MKNFKQQLYLFVLASLETLNIGLLLVAVMAVVFLGSVGVAPFR